MTRGEWVLLPGLLGMLGLLGFAFRVDSASLSGFSTANEIEESRVCAYLCEINPAGKPCEVFCTSRRQFTIQSNTVAGERDVVVSVEETRRDACPTLCRHGIRAPICICERSEGSYAEVPGPDVAWKIIRDLFREDESRVDGCPECQKSHDHSGRNNEKIEKTDSTITLLPAKIPRSSMDVDVASFPRGGAAKSYVNGERGRVDAEVDLSDCEPRKAGRLQRTMLKRTDDEIEDFDLDKFCEIECAKGNGGLACRCDIIPS